MATRRRNTSFVFLTGIEECDKLLKAVGKKIGNRVVRTVLNRAVGMASKKIKAQTSVRSVKRSIGKKVKAKGGKIDAKAGGAVGIKKSKGVPKGGTRGGVGIGAANVHWYILGTAERRTKKGANRGRMPPHDIVKDAVNSRQIVNFIKRELPRELEEQVRKERLKALGRYMQKQR
jgi:hypothetical protein